MSFHNDGTGTCVSRRRELMSLSDIKIAVSNPIQSLVMVVFIDHCKNLRQKHI